jgi:hypothetical protein
VAGIVEERDGIGTDFFDALDDVGNCHPQGGLVSVLGDYRVLRKSA